MAAWRRPRLAARRRAEGFTQETLAAELGADRTTVARWERCQCDPQPYFLPRLAGSLNVSLAELHELLTPEPASGGRRGLSTWPEPLNGPVVPSPVVMADADFEELEDMNRRELLRLLSVAGAAVAVPDPAAADALAQMPADEAGHVGQYELLNAHLWQVFALTPSKRTVYPTVRHQFQLLTESLEQARSLNEHRRLCAAMGNLLQLTGEIFFDSDRYTEAAHCYTLAADAGREAGAFDLWACALVRHAYVGMYERRFKAVTPMLEAAARVARRGDPELSTRHWVAVVQAEAHAGLGDRDACERALDTADQVQALTGPPMPGGWLRFDGSRLAEQRGTCYATLGRDELAERSLTEALDGTTSLRRRGGILADLAALGIRTGDLDRVLTYGSQAAAIAEQTRSSGYVGRRLGALRSGLVSFPDDRAAQLSDRLAQL